jgi:hypothetical protein
MRGLNDDRGATIVLIAIALAVVLGMAGLVVDVGALYEERRELQNGADAAVLAIAEDCALERPCDSGAAAATASHYVSANADDGISGVDLVDLDVSGKTVTVQVSTITDEGSTKVEPYFGRVVGWEGSTVGASATAIWGFPSALRSSIPLVISECEFPDRADIPSEPRTIYFHDGNNAEPCNAQAGMDTDGDGMLSGGFGWLVSPTGDCRVNLGAGQWISDDPGASPTTGCSPDFMFGLVGTEVPLPFFDDLYGLGSNGQYHIAGFGMFHITGFNFGGLFKAPTAQTAPCGGDERCLSGYFTTGVVYDGEPGGEDHGLVIVELIG